MKLLLRKAKRSESKARNVKEHALTVSYEMFIDLMSLNNDLNLPVAVCGMVITISF